MEFNISKTIENFIETKHPETEEETDGVYRPKIKRFEDFLLNKLGWFNIMDVTYIKTLKTKDLIESMDYYIIESRKESNPKDHVTKKSSLNNYFTVLRQFFKYLHEIDILNQQIINAIVKWESNSKLKDEIIDEVVRKNNLEERSSISIYTKDEIDKFLETFQEYFILIKKQKNIHVSKYYDIFMSGLVLFFIYETGIKVDKLKFITCNNLFVENKYIQINKIKVPLSDEFIYAISYYLKFYNNRKKDDHLFINLQNGKKIGETKTLLKFLSKMKKSDVTGIQRYRLKYYLEQGIPKIVIKEITGHNFKFINETIVNNYNVDYSYINNQLSKIKREVR